MCYESTNTDETSAPTAVETPIYTARKRVAFKLMKDAWFGVSGILAGLIAAGPKTTTTTPSIDDMVPNANDGPRYNPPAITDVDSFETVRGLLVGTMKNIQSDLETAACHTGGGVVATREILETYDLGIVTLLGVVGNLRNDFAPNGARAHEAVSEVVAYARSVGKPLSEIYPDGTSYSNMLWDMNKVLQGSINVLEEQTA